MKTSIAMGIGLVGLALVLSSLLKASNPVDSQNLTVVQTTTPQVPVIVGERVPSHGQVQVAISVDHTGKLTDFILMSYTHRRFADVAVQALKEWEYRPAMINGQPSDVTTVVTLNFDLRGQVISLSRADSTTAFVQGMLDDRVVRCLFPARELDAAPKATHVVSPPSIRSPLKVERSVTVEFFIDETGVPRLATVGAGEDKVLAAAALKAIEQWRFEPGMRKGVPVVVKASQQFVFPAEYASAN